MHIISDAQKDAAAALTNPGGYEWWYFDAIDSHSGYSFVVIFYRGNPFSNRYIQQLKKDPNSLESYPGHFPAVSISIYKDQSPVYYSFTEFKKEAGVFRSEDVSIAVGYHRVSQSITLDQVTYKLDLQEKLPSGDSIRAELEFCSPNEKLPLRSAQSTESKGHCWNLVQPRAEVEGEIQLFRDSIIEHDIQFKGTGYHDHNTGQEPMKDEFRDWYWGRFHFEAHTLVYYVMNRKEDQQYEVFLINHHTDEIDHSFNNMELKDHGLTIFGLNSARKLIMQCDNTEIVVQLSSIADNGPFYQRFFSNAFLSVDGQDVRKSRGVSEYIYPARIYQKLFWPLVDMRIQYKQEKTHWVQKSSRLYRWTW